MAEIELSLSSSPTLDVNAQMKYEMSSFIVSDKVQICYKDLTKIMQLIRQHLLQYPRLKILVRIEIFILESEVLIRGDIAAFKNRLAWINFQGNVAVNFGMSWQLFLCKPQVAIMRKKIDHNINNKLINLRRNTCVKRVEYFSRDHTCFNFS